LRPAHQILRLSNQGGWDGWVER